MSLFNKIKGAVGNAVSDGIGKGVDNSRHDDHDRDLNRRDQHEVGQEEGEVRRDKFADTSREKGGSAERNDRRVRRLLG